MQSTLKQVVFLDRDGVINEDRDDYVKSVDELTVFSYAPEAIARLNDAGYIVAVVSNQQCIAKGLMKYEQLIDIQNEISKTVETAGGKITSFYYCTHLESANCSCRKPKTGMLEQACKEHHLEPNRGFIVGDNEKDIIAGRTMGCRTVLVLSGMAILETADAMTDPPDFVADNLESAVDWILSVNRSSRTE